MNAGRARMWTPRAERDAARAEPTDERFKVNLLACCSLAELRWLDRITYPIAVGAGCALTEEGDTDLAFFVILHGRAAVNVDGVEIARLGLGHCFGEAALLRRCPQPATVTALCAMSLAVASERDFAEVASIDSLRSALIASAAAWRDIEAHSSAD